MEGDMVEGIYHGKGGRQRRGAKGVLSKDGCMDDLVG